MGTSYDVNNSNPLGIIPRAVKDIFEGIQKRNDMTFTVKVSFLEVYKEEIFDLFGNSKEAIQIREDANGLVKAVGLQELDVDSESAVLEKLCQGSKNRKTGSTNMNELSSRSHALFTLGMIMSKIAGESRESMSAKFHLVDLAGSEKAKKTGASGDRFKEGVNINKGLLSLGNVISALCDKSSHVPYRDSKLTRLLQDSLGGNSHTVMVACVSPADTNLEETVNTLRYADRARKIKNKPIINMDPKLIELENLRTQYTTLNLTWIAHLEKCPLRKQINMEAVEKENKVEVESTNVTEVVLLHKTSINGETEPVKEEKSIEMKEKSKEKVKRNVQSKVRTNETSKLGNKQSNSSADTIQPQQVCPKVTKLPDSDCILEVKLVEQEQEIRNLSETNAELLKYWAETCTQSNIFQNQKIQLEETLQDWKGRFENIFEQIRTMERINVADAQPSKELLETIHHFSEAVVHVNNNVFDASNDKENVTEFFDPKIALEKLEAELEIKQKELLKHEENKIDFEPLKKTAEEQQKQIEILEKEKAALESFLKSNPSAKISEERRKKIAALEKQVCLLRKQLDLNKKALKAKEDAEKKLNLLNLEINTLKRSRVAMMKQQEKLNKISRDQRLKTAQETAQANKKLNSLFISNQRLETRSRVIEQKLRQSEVAKRLLEEKLAKRHIKTSGKPYRKTSEFIHDFLKEEIAFAIRCEDVNEHVAELMAARKDLQAEKISLERELTLLQEQPPEKRSLSGDETTGFIDVDMKSEKLLEKLKELKETISSRTEQISMFHKKILKVDPEELRSNRLKILEDSEDLKEGLSYLFDQVVTCQRQLSKSTCQMSAAMDEVQSAENDKKELQWKLANLKTEHQKELSKEKEKHEEAIHFLVRESRDKLLNMLQDASSISILSAQEDPKLLDHFNEQSKEISGLHYIHEELKKKTKECDDLRQLNSALQNRNRKSLFLDCSVTPMAQKKVKLEKMEEAYEEDQDEDDTSKDPDWKKTPFHTYRKLSTRPASQKPKLNLSFTSSDSESEELPKKRGIKRSTSAKGCQCGNGACKTTRCPCRKKNADCKILCKCPTDKCTNHKELPDINSVSSQNAVKSEEMNTTFLEEMPLHEIENLKDGKPSTSKSQKVETVLVNPGKRKLHKLGTSFFKDPK